MPCNILIWIIVPYDKPMPRTLSRLEVQGKCERKGKERGKERRKRTPRRQERYAR